MTTAIIIISLVLGGLAIYAWLRVGKHLEQERQDREREITTVAFEVRDLLDAIVRLESTKAKVGQCGKAVKLLAKAAKHKECRDVINNFDQLKERLEKLRIVLPVMECVKTANKHQIRSDRKAELASLVAALEHIREHDITDADIAIAENRPVGSDIDVTVASVENRLAGLGWTEPDPLDEGWPGMN